MFTVRKKQQSTEIILDQDTRKIMLMSDIHFDSPECDRNKLKRDLNMAKGEGMPVFIFGDLFDVMGGMRDRRSKKGDIRKEYDNANYFGSIVEDAVNFFKPYKDTIAFISLGNHEDSTLAINEIDLTKMFIIGLNPDIAYGKYTGFVSIILHTPHKTWRKVLYYTHGSGGNSPSTKGMPKALRRSGMIEADLYVSGHIHQDWETVQMRTYLDKGGNIRNKETVHAQLSAYKEAGQWEKSREFPATYIGGRIAKFEPFTVNQGKIDYRILTYRF